MISSVLAPQAVCRFGAARCDVTPPVGIYHRMWGAATHDRSTGVHRPLTATALVFGPLDGADTDPAQELVLIAVDHCLLWSREMDLVLTRAAAKADVPRERIVVCFSHTHAAGLMGLERRDLPGGDLIPPYLDELGDRFGTIVAQARAATQPATVVAGVGRCDLAGNRDLFDEDSQQWVCGFRPGGPVDDAALVARITSEAGATLATIVDYGCHPTTLAWGNSLISPDYPGAMREVVERATGAPCAFLQGASGDVGPRDGFVGDVAVADRNGRQLGYAALSALEALPPPRTRFEYAGPVVSGATIGTWARRPGTAADVARWSRFQVERFVVELDYPRDRPTRAALEAERDEWSRKERDATARGDAAAARDGRAMVERKTRALVRCDALPPGDRFPYPVTLARTGDVLWLTVEGEPYQRLQTELRGRFPGVPIFVSVLANGSRCSYLPPVEAYGTGLYQESIAVLARGSLERAIRAIGDRIAGLESRGKS